MSLFYYLYVEEFSHQFNEPELLLLTTIPVLDQVNMTHPAQLLSSLILPSVFFTF